MIEAFRKRLRDFTIRGLFRDSGSVKFAKWFEYLNIYIPNHDADPSPFKSNNLFTLSWVSHFHCTDAILSFRHSSRGSRSIVINLISDSRFSRKCDHANKGKASSFGASCKTTPAPTCSVPQSVCFTFRLHPVFFIWDSVIFWYQCPLKFPLNFISNVP